MVTKPGRGGGKHIKRFLLYTVLLSWFFGIRFQTDTAGVYAVWVQGPYSTKLECDEAMKESEAKVEVYFPRGSYVFSRCNQPPVES
jgi:hypothetical protein